MKLAIQVTWYKFFIALAGVIILGGLALMETDGGNIGLLISMLIYAIALFLVIKGLERGMVWVAALYCGFCVFDVLSTLPDGLNLSNSLALVAAVLSTMAAYDIVMWLSERRRSKK